MQADHDTTTLINCCQQHPTAFESLQACWQQPGILPVKKHQAPQLPSRANHTQASALQSLTRQPAAGSKKLPIHPSMVGLNQTSMVGLQHASIVRLVLLCLQNLQPTRWCHTIYCGFVRTSDRNRIQMPIVQCSGLLYRPFHSPRPYCDLQITYAPKCHDQAMTKGSTATDNMHNYTTLHQTHPCHLACSATCLMHVIAKQRTQGETR